MALSDSQLDTFKADILANTDPAVVSALAAGADNAIAAWYNQDAVPAFVVWKTRVYKQDLYEMASPVGQVWNWTFYVGLNPGEQGAWLELFSDPGDGSMEMHPHLPQVRSAWNEIFAGPQTSPANLRAHIESLSKRDATYAEKLFATGTGTTATPATMSFEGSVSSSDVRAALNRP